MEKILSLHHRSTTVEGCHQHFPGIFSWNTQSLKRRSGRFQTVLSLIFLQSGMLVWWVSEMSPFGLYITKEISWASHEETAHSSKFKRPALPCICLIRLYWFSTICATKPLWLTLFINWKCGRSDSVVKADTTRRLEGRSRWNIHPRQNYTSYHSQAVFMMLGAMCIWDVPLNLKLCSYSFGSY